MDIHGRKIDVIIKQGGIEEVNGILGSYTRDTSDILRIWADEGMEKYLKCIPGIYDVESDGIQYAVRVDPRYDIEFIKREIVAQIKTHQKVIRRGAWEKEAIIRASKKIINEPILEEDEDAEANR